MPRNHLLSLLSTKRIFSIAEVEALVRFSSINHLLILSVSMLLSFHFFMCSYLQISSFCFKEIFRGGLLIMDHTVASTTSLNIFVFLAGPRDFGSGGSFFRMIGRVASTTSSLFMVQPDIKC
jgi:hypothetical protein